jgi:hypothetical protein
MLIVEFYIGQTTWLFYLEVRETTTRLVFCPLRFCHRIFFRLFILLHLFLTISCILLRRATRSGASIVDLACRVPLDKFLSFSDIMQMYII